MRTIPDVPTATVATVGHPFPVAAPLANAVRYSPDGGPIDVVLREEASGRVSISVRDRGVGIPRDKRDRIFERFGRAHGSRFGGLGLGLAIARAIVDLHGGAIEVESSGIPGDGSTFTVRLPIHGAMPAVTANQ